jgi:phosphohistidine phosphatase
VTDDHRLLVLMRHAKSAYPAGVVDHDRPLAPRGVHEARLAGDWLRANLPAVQQVLCSTAIRARQTLARSGVEAPVRYAQSLYGADFATVIDEIGTVGDDVTTVLVVGHEPTVSDVALQLAGIDSVAAQRIAQKFPTSALAVLEVPGGWQQLKAGAATLTDFHVPR